MAEAEWLAERFEEHRSRLRAVAYRMLGSLTDADDAVQDAWVRVSRAGAGEVENLGGWLTTVVARVCLNMLRARSSRREQAWDGRLPDPIVSPPGDLAPEEEVLLADSVGLALQVVLDTLSPVERPAFVLHDMFELPFEEIAPMVGRTPDAARQLASRARRRVRGADTAVPDSGLADQRAVVDAFYAAGAPWRPRGPRRRAPPGCGPALGLRRDRCRRHEGDQRRQGRRQAGATRCRSCLGASPGSGERNGRGCRDQARATLRRDGLHRGGRPDHRDRHRRRPETRGPDRRLRAGRQPQVTCRAQPTARSWRCPGSFLGVRRRPRGR